MTRTFGLEPLLLVRRVPVDRPGSPARTIPGAILPAGGTGR